jgi:phosphoglycolate phosphatase-like HAD superfamily hydrolase
MISGYDAIHVSEFAAGQRLLRLLQLQRPRQIPVGVSQTVNFQMKHAVIFDVDGTLLRSSQQDDMLYRQAVEKVLGTVSYRSDLADYIHVSDSGILNQLLIDNGFAADPKTISAIKTEFLLATEKYVSECGPFEEVPGARSLLAKLKSSERHAVAIATGGWRRTAEFKLTSAGFELDGVPLRTSDDAIDRVDIMQLALDSLGDGLQSITYYGDGPWDEQACLKLGWSFRAVGATLRGIGSYEDELIE